MPSSAVVPSPVPVAPATTAPPGHRQREDQPALLREAPGRVGQQADAEERPGDRAAEGRDPLEEGEHHHADRQGDDGRAPPGCHGHGHRRDERDPEQALARGHVHDRELHPALDRDQTRQRSVGTRAPQGADAREQAGGGRGHAAHATSVRRVDRPPAGRSRLLLSDERDRPRSAGEIVATADDTPVSG
jgi:hypothetical protein